jgi:hypothetical protein
MVPSPVWEVNLREGVPRVSLGVPAALLNETFYVLSEFLSLTGFGHVVRRADVENDSEYFLFMATHWEPLDSPEVLAVVVKFLVGALGVVEKMAGDEALSATLTRSPSDAFWRALIELGPELASDLTDLKLDRHLETDRHGAHIRLERREGKGVLRVKARSLEQLRALLRAVETEFDDGLGL